jgi:peptidoglycan/LPS O-acetylase OafA/YrhL
MISIQILRAVAAVLVVIYHVTEKAKTQNIGNFFFDIGAAGVDLFFIISGFIMMMVSTREKSTISFINKRAMRILPLYYIFTTMALTLYLVAPWAINSQAKETNVLLSYLFIPLENKPMLLLVGWTLTYEIFFYFVFSLFVFTKNFRWLYISVAMVTFSLISQKYDLFLISYLGNNIIYEFIFGIIIHELYRKKGHIITPLTQPNILLILFGVVLLFTSSTFEYSRVIEFGVPAMLIFIGVINIDSKINKQNKAISMLAYTGDASYSIYLSHLFSIGIITLAFKKLNLFTTDLYEVYFITSVILSLFSGAFTYKVLENPINNWLKKYR